MQSFSLGPYQVDVYRRPFQRTLTLRVPMLGRLKVSCGLRVPMKEVIKFIHEKMDFVEACHVALETQKAKSPVQNFVSGEKCPFLGQDRELIVKSIADRKTSKAKLEAGKLVVLLRGLESESDKASEVHQALQKFYRKSATNYLSHLIEVRSQQMNLYPTRLSFRSQRTRWGSCSSQGSISLNWRLIAGSHEVMDYVVVHELAHLQHQDHSKRFWDLVETHCPNYRLQKKWLRDNHYLFDFLA